MTTENSIENSRARIIMQAIERGADARLRAERGVILQVDANRLVLAFAAEALFKLETSERQARIDFTADLCFASLVTGIGNFANEDSPASSDGDTAYRQALLKEEARERFLREASRGSSPEPAGRWLPITDEVKDGRLIIGWVGYWGEQVMARWDKQSNQWRDSLGALILDAVGACIGDRLTHYYPAPPPFKTEPPAVPTS